MTEESILNRLNKLEDQVFLADQDLIHNKKESAHSLGYRDLLRLRLQNIHFYRASIQTSYFETYGSLWERELSLLEDSVEFITSEIQKLP